MTFPKNVVMFSGGVGSWAAAKRIALERGVHGLVLLFADTCMEDEDLYRFLHDAAANVGGELVITRDGRTPWQVFKDERYVGNSRIDPCSKILKRKRLDDWRNQNCDPGETELHVGLLMDEVHRLNKLRSRVGEWKYSAPMCRPELLTKDGVLRWCRSEGLRPPRLYKLGFPHNNCGGFCVKAGQAHFAHLLKMLPGRYKEHEEHERRAIKELGDDAAILRDRRGGETKPLTLEQLRKRHERQSDLFDLEEWGGCGCAID